MQKETPRLSPSIAHKLTTESALSAWSAHRLLGNHREPPSSSQIEGTLWHAFILGDMSHIEVIDCADFKTKAAKEARDKALFEGKTPMAAPKAAGFRAGAANIGASLDSLGIVIDGTVERRIEWSEYTDSGKELLCSGYIDHHKGGKILELKTGKIVMTTRMATNLIAKSHALLQGVAYPNALVALDDIDADEIEMTFVFAQTRPPWSVTPVRLGGDFLELAHLRWRRAIHLWRECLDLDEWPDVTAGVEVISAPGWMIAEEIELEVLRDE